MRYSKIGAIVLLILSIAFTQHVNAQVGKPSKIDVVMADNEEIYGDFRRFEAIANGQNVMYMLYNSFSSKIISIDIKTGKFLAKTFRDDLFDIDGMYPLSYKVVDDKLYCFYNKYDKQADRMYVYATVLDPQGKFLVKDKQMMNVQSKSKYRVKLEVELFENQYFVINSKVVIDKSDEEELTVFKFDKDLKETGKASFNNKEIFLKKDGKMLPGKHGFDNELFLITIFNERKGSMNKNVSTLYAIDNNSKTTLTQELNTENVSLFDFKLIKTPTSTRLYAYYSDDKSEGIDGVITFQYSKELKKFTTLSSSKFSRELKENFMSRRRARKEKGISNFEFSDFVVLPNGGLQVVLEQVVRSSVRVNSPVGGVNSSLNDRYVTVYSSTDHQLITSYDSTGKLVKGYALNTPSVYKGEINYRVFSLTVINNKSYLYFSALPKSFGRSLRPNIIDYQKSKEGVVFYYDLSAEPGKGKFVQVTPAFEKRFVPIRYFALSGSNKFGVVAAKIKPRFFVGLAMSFFYRPKVKIGFFDLPIKQ